jgi:hypothetical protein
VAPAPDRNLQIAVAGESHCPGRVGWGGASGNEAGVTVDCAVPDGAGLVVLRMAAGDLLTSELVDFHSRNLRFRWR